MQVLAAVSKYCIERNIAFKHLRSIRRLIELNSKAGSRSGSGKLVTIYPDSDEQLQIVLRDLSDELAGESGPYLLSDLRIGAGPLYVRYGAFRLRMAEIDGEQVPVIERPDGVLVRDERRPSLRIPEWVTVPDFLQPHLAARSTTGPSELPYEIVRSLHFSNGGGVYLARSVDGRSIVLKEARPHAGLDDDGDDAVVRLRREHDVLLQLAGIEGVPQVIDRFSLWEHEFLAIEHRGGVQLGAWMAMHYPLMNVGAAPADLAGYAARVARIGSEVERIIRAVHARGLTHGDLHTNNVLVDSGDTAGDETVSLIDFEISRSVTDTRRPALGAAGFRSPRNRRGIAVDEYALAILRLRMVVPYVAMYDVSPDSAHVHLAFAERRFPLPPGYADAIRGRLEPVRLAATHDTEGDGGQASVAVNEVIDGVVKAIEASATPERVDRLFPGDITQFTVGGAGFGCGAAGVLYALAVAGAGRFREYEDWLLASVTTSPVLRPGFYDGIHGIAYTLDYLGHRDAAAQLVDQARPMVQSTRNHDVESGLAGIGLNLLHLGQIWGSPELELEAFRVGARLRDLLAVATSPGREGRAGLSYGWSGPALFALRLFEHAGEKVWLDLAEQAVQRDLEECVEAGDDSLQVRDPAGRRTLPYLGVGSAGVLLAVDRLNQHRPTPEREKAARMLTRACASEIVAHPGLMLGRAGLIITLSQLRSRDELVEPVLARHVDRLALHAVSHRGGIAFPGNQLMRLSMDVSTGGAGVLLALAAVNGDGLPFVGAGTGQALPLATTSGSTRGSEEHER